MSKIDSAGVYRGEITSAVLGFTKASSYPQWVAQVKADEKYIESPEELAHFELSEPGWVDWAAYGETADVYLVLFTVDPNEPGAALIPGENSLFHYEDLQNALGWDGNEFDSLNDGSHVGKKIQFRAEEDTYQDKTRVRVQGVAKFDAPPHRELSAIDASTVKSLNNLLKKSSTAKPAAAKPAAAKPAAKPNAKTATAAAPKTAPKAAPKPEATPEPETTVELADEVSLDDAWNYIGSIQGDTEDSVVEEAWIASASEVMEEAGFKEESQMTNAHWAKVRDIAIRDLGLTVA